MEEILVKGMLVVFAAAVAVVLYLRHLEVVGQGLQGGEGAGWTAKEDLTPEAIRLRAWMRRLVEPTFLLISSEEGFSKRGGAPNLPASEPWPIGSEGPPCEFLLQIDLSAVPQGRGKMKGHPWLPQSGRMFVFLDPDGDQRIDQVRVLFHPSAEEAWSVAAPADVAIRPEQRLGLRRYRSAPDIEWLGPKAAELAGDLAGEVEFHEEAAGYTRATFGGCAQRIGGFPDGLQPECLRLRCEVSARQAGEFWQLEAPLEPDEDLEKASQAWRLLLQLETEPRAEWKWPGDGTLFVFIRREDAMRGDFTRTVTIGQLA